ncbi:alkylated DNA repair protein AlkB [Cryptococcus depauperatus]|nr:alkylated DNA repair protein AlkB [Cryptococcus depauperatus CBS 7855]
MGEAIPERTHTAFRLAEKHFKNRAYLNRYPSLLQWKERLIDLSRSQAQEDDEVWQAGWWSPENETELINNQTKKSKQGKEKEKGERANLDTSNLSKLRLKDGAVAYVVAPGCILIPDYMSASQQLTFLHDSLARYTLPPNPLSLTTHYNLPDNLFDLYVSNPQANVYPKHMTGAIDSQHSASKSQPKSRTLNDTEPASVIGYDEIIARNKNWTGDVPSDKLGIKTAERLMKELRWANLGWIYQWSTKSYNFALDDPIPFPAPLADICSSAVASIPWEQVFSDLSEDEASSYHYQSWSENYKPDTGIVNLYQLNDTLMAHVDRAELDPARPLVSISLGHAAILLLGTASRNDTPIPIILRSGDMLIMSGKGRQSYHGIPRIMEGTLPSHFQLEQNDSPQMRAAKQWISTARININARQVFPPGFKRPR